PGATITIHALSGTPNTAPLSIQETGDDDLKIAGYALGGTFPLNITVAPPSAPFTIPDGGAPVPLTLGCSSAVPFSGSDTLSVDHTGVNIPPPATYTVDCLVADPPQITTASPLPGGITGTVYATVTFAAINGFPAYGGWGATVPAQLPPGLSINP